MGRATLNFVMDLATFLVMLAMIATGLLLRFVLPPGSGERRSVWDLTRHEWGDVHFWLAVTLGAFVLIHLILHWDWVCSFVVRWFRKRGAPPQPPSAWRRNLAGLAVAAVTVLLVGGFIWAAQAARVEREGGGRQLRSGRGGGEEVRPEGMERDDGAREGSGRQFRGGRGRQSEERSPGGGGGTE